ncbi:FAD binding domain-containing protein [Paraburkholderia susongensis]|uniref:2-polyprenyl-6-methoxyphenol hydroxylase n=1 Tax=Paraburkholderia susongensis TaxID=1515439 RepID=A0A1X7M4Z1_9BURK|nr:FAD binding domain-containing protein [Paraburkholderia susongensis]SMG60459.1 2-polyprenyl-6-methoxyphenol hydroxylase [Paraburkholderia susongensis]
MADKKSRRAVVIGGSLGGLFTAASLRAIGWTVDVYERSVSELDSRGGGLVVQPDLLEAFRFAGIAHAPQLGVPSRDRQYLDASGKVLFRQRMPQAQTAWSVLYNTLKAGLPDGIVRAGVALSDFVQDGDGVEAILSNGERVRADLLIAADGPHSTTRSLLLPDDFPDYAGYVAWRGLLPETAVDGAAAARLVDAFTFQSGAAHQLLTYLIPGEDGSTRPGERRWNWVWYRPLAAGAPLDAALTDRYGVRRTLSVPPGALSDESRARLRADAGEQLAPALAALVHATDAPFLQIIQDYRAPKLVFDRAVLLGDAAFVARPHTGAGAAKAAANAVALAQRLRDPDGSIDEALAQWEAVEWHNGMRLYEFGINLGAQIMGDLSLHTAR